MSDEESASDAVSLFLGGYNCAESVLLALAARESIESPIIPKIATPFGGGIARTGSICGCVTGALMGIGLRFGRMKTTEDRERAYSVAANFLNAFERKFGSTICYELIGCDFRTPDGHKRWEQLKESRCANFVKGAVDIVVYLEGRDSRHQFNNTKKTL